MDPELMSQSEIALLARVTKPAVMTWRRRHPDFPAPAPGRVGHPLFAADEVVTWLLRTGLGNTDPETLRAERSLHTLSTYARRHGGLRTITAFGAALCLRHLAGRALPSDPLPLARRLDPDDEFLLTELTELTESVELTERANVPEPTGLGQIVEQLIEGAFDASRAYQFLIISAGRLGWPELTADALTPETLALIRQVSDLPGRLSAHPTVTIADPHAGSGDLLAALLDGQDGDNLRISATSTDHNLARLIRRRLLLAEVPEFQFDVRNDGLSEEFADSDLIVTRMPYQPAETREALTDLDHIEALTDLLRPGRTAVVVGPASSLVDELRDPPAAVRRAALLASGIVEAVVRLPGGVYPARPGYPSALWLLTRDPNPATKGRLLLADLGGTRLDQRAVEAAADDILLWRAEGYRRDGHAPRTGRLVTLESLDLRRGAALRVSGPASATLIAGLAADRPALIGEVERRLADAERQTIWYAEQHGPVYTGAIQRYGKPPADVSIGALLAARRLRKLPGHRLSPHHVTANGRHRVVGAADLTGTGPHRWIDRFTLAGEYPQVAFTEPGDLIVTVIPRWAVQLDPDGFSVIEFPACGLRVTAGDTLTPPVLKALLDTARNTTRAPGAVRGPHLRSVTIPDVAADEVARLDRLLRPITERERLLHQQAGLLDELRQLAVTGFADGTLTTDSTMYGMTSE